MTDEPRPGTPADQPERDDTVVTPAADQQRHRHTPAVPYTIHADADRPAATDPPTAAVPEAEGTGAGRRRWPDPLALVGGLVALVVAVTASVGPGVVGALDPRWVLAGVAIVVGVLVLASTARRRT